MSLNSKRLQELAGIKSGKLLTESVEGEPMEETSEVEVAEVAEADEAGDEDELTESRLRQIIRDEIKSSMGTASWLYGDKPSNSVQGRVTRGFLGVGFTNK